MVGEIDDQHLSGAEAAAVDDCFRIEIDESGLGAEDDKIVLGDEVSARAQAIAIEDRADQIAISESNRGRAIPWLGGIAGIGEEG